VHINARTEDWRAPAFIPEQKAISVETFSKDPPEPNLRLTEGAPHHPASRANQLIWKKEATH
jgi:hypothetical protein